jgi:hypothetical protein
MQRIIIEFDGGGEGVHLTVPTSGRRQAQPPSGQPMAAAGALDGGAAPSLTGAGIQPGMAMPPMGADMGMLTTAAGGEMFDAGAAPQSE